jgi:hypothetical protein
MKTKEQVESENVKFNFNKRIEMFNNDIKTNEKLFEETNEIKFYGIVKNLRARRGELQFISKNYF